MWNVPFPIFFLTPAERWRPMVKLHRVIDTTRQCNRSSNILHSNFFSEKLISYYIFTSCVCETDPTSGTIGAFAAANLLAHQAFKRSRVMPQKSARSDNKRPTTSHAWLEFKRQTVLISIHPEQEKMILNRQYTVHSMRKLNPDKASQIIKLYKQHYQ